jgi:MoxR-like ATPase
MVTYDNREVWESLYEKFKPQRDAALEALESNPLQPFSQLTMDKIWELCVAVADEVKGNHNEITSGRQSAAYFPYSVVDADVTNQTVSVEYKDLDSIRFGIENVVYQCIDTIENIEHVFTKVGLGGNLDERNKVLSLRNVLPMLSLGIFQKGGKDWLDLCHTDVEVGDPTRSDPRKIGNAISLSGHLKNSDSKPSKLTSKGYKSTADEVKEICSLLKLRKNVILEGVPGTGKTRIRKEVQKNMEREVEMKIVTFHPASTYEEFVGGIFPFSKDNSKLLFKYQEGVLTRFANEAMNDLERDYILFIDEINRANIPLVMGELLTIIEPTKRTTPVVGTKALSDGSRDVDGEPWEVAVHVEKEEKNSKYLRLPSNLYFLATMNTSDRSVVSMDAALRRRFAYYRIKTKLTTESQEEMWTALKDYWLGDKKDTFDTVFSVLAKINQYLRTSIGPDAMLGHSYLFFNDDEVADLDENQVVSEMMELNILPQIADTLTSMNKTDQNSVDSINKLLSKMPVSMFRHELKAPTSGGKSLDIAVTVCERNNTSIRIIANLSKYDDDEIFVMNNDNAGPKIKDISGYMVEKDSAFIVLKGSGSISPEFHIKEEMGNIKVGTIEQLKQFSEKRNILIVKGDIKEINEDYGVFQNDVTFDSINPAASMVRGTTVTAKLAWKRQSDNQSYENK